MIDGMVPLDDGARFRFPANRWRHYERLTRFPAGSSSPATRCAPSTRSTARGCRSRRSRPRRSTGPSPRGSSASPAGSTRRPPPPSTRPGRSRPGRRPTVGDAAGTAHRVLPGAAARRGGPRPGARRGLPAGEPPGGPAAGPDAACAGAPGLARARHPRPRTCGPRGASDRPSEGPRRGSRDRRPGVTLTASAAAGRVRTTRRCPASWTVVSLHEIPVCGTGVQPLRLLDMISAATHAHLVVRRHVDLMRTHAMICWPC